MARFEPQEKKISLLGHLKELRQRMIKSVIAVVVGTIISFVFADQIFEILTLPARGAPLVYMELAEMFSTYMKVCIISGMILATPFATYQFLMFITPALKAKEKRAIYIVLPWIGMMFAGGVIFGYFVLLPPALGFLFNFGSDIATPQIRIANYVTVLVRLLLAIGLVFELPVITTFLSRIGIISSQWLARKRKPAIIIAFVAAGLITPTADPVNQCLVAVPLILLYELSIWLAKLVQKKKPQPVSVSASAPQP